MKQTYILVIDTGSSSMRGLLYNQNGEVLFTRRLTYFMETTGDNAAQQDSRCYQDCLLQICSAAAAACKGQFALSAIAFTSQRSSVLALDEAGQPLRPILMWYDKRSAAICRGMDAQNLQKIYEISGLRLTPILSAPKMLWLKQAEPALYERSHKLAGIHDYLLYLCTGRFVTDASLAGRTSLLDIRSGSWSEELLHLFSIDSSKLCRVVPCGSIAGYLTQSFAQQTQLPQGLPVITAGGDQQCSLLGQGILPGDIGITSGTASYVTALSKSPAADTLRRLNTSIAVTDHDFVLEASNMASGSVYNWFRETFYGKHYEISAVNEEVLQSPPGADGLLMQPDLAGAGCPHWDNMARGSFYNIGFHHTRADFARAVLEGICAQIAECYFTLEECCPSAGTVLSAGGLSRLPAFNQMIADMIARPVTVCTQNETTGLGAFIRAAVTLGLYKDAAEAGAALAASKKDDGKYPAVFTPDKHTITLYQRQANARRYLRNALDSSRLMACLDAQQTNSTESPASFSSARHSSSAAESVIR